MRTNFKDVGRFLNRLLPPNAVRRVTVPGFGGIAFARDDGDAERTASCMFATNLKSVHRRGGKVVAERDHGSGLITLVFVNILVAEAVTGTTAIPSLSRFKYMDSGVGTTAAADTDTALEAPTGLPRVVAALSNAQTAVSGVGTPPDTATLLYTGTITYTGSFAVTEFGLFDSSGGGNMMDHKIVAAYNVVATDQITWLYSLQIPAAG